MASNFETLDALTDSTAFVEKIAGIKENLVEIILSAFLEQREKGRNEVINDPDAYDLIAKDDALEYVSDNYEADDWRH
jgi:hypothetical protein